MSVRSSHAISSMKISFSEIYLMFFSPVFGCQNMVNDNSKILSLLNQFQIKHCIVVDEDYRSLFQSVKHFSYDRIFTTFMDINFLIIHLESGYFLNHKTAIVIKPDQMFEVFNDYFNYFDHHHAISSYTWIVFGTTTYEVSLRIRNFYIPYNCEFFIITCRNETDYEVDEIYNADVANVSAKSVNNLGVWSENKWKVTALPRDLRRFNLRGINMYMETPYLDICLIMHDCIHAEILTEIGKMMNFTITFAWYIYFENVSYLASAKIQSVVYDGSFFYSDIFGPLFSLSGYFHIKDDLGEQYGVSKFTAPFSQKIWFRILYSSLIASIIIFCIEFWRRSDERKTYKFIKSITVAIRPFEIFCNQSGSKVDRSFTSRLAWLSVRVAASIIVPAYSATLISYVTIAVPKLPFTDLKSFLEDGTYKISGINGTYGHLFFQVSSDPVVKEISEKLLLNKTPMHGMEAIHWMCNSDMKYSFISYNDDMYQRGPLECKIRKIPKAIFSVSTGLMLPLYSPFKSVFTRNLHRFYTTGVLHKMNKFLMGTMPIDKTENFSPITLIRVVPLLYLVAVANLAGFVMLIIEIIWKLSF